jgi:flagellar hook-basal body complex protein FliE
VNGNQSAAKDMVTRYEMGDPKVDLPEVMIALQKSSVSFQAMTQVRNKMIEAYKEIINMPL